jgi:hypothetical protein
MKDISRSTSKGRTKLPSSINKLKKLFLVLNFSIIQYTDGTRSLPLLQAGLIFLERKKNIEILLIFLVEKKFKSYRD